MTELSRTLPVRSREMLTDFGGVGGDDPRLGSVLGVVVHVVDDPCPPLIVLPTSSREEDGSARRLRYPTDRRP
jgi:hypothetical protein